MFPIGDDNSGERSVPIVTFALIALNVLFFVLELGGGDAFVKEWAFVPSRFHAQPAADFPTLFTSMFMHAGWLHLLLHILSVCLCSGRDWKRNRGDSCPGPRSHWPWYWLYTCHRMHPRRGRAETQVAAWHCSSTHDYSQGASATALRAAIRPNARHSPMLPVP